jgi:hypothetical protein
VQSLEEEELIWVEEPTRADDFAGHARIAGDCRTPVSDRRKFVGTTRPYQEPLGWGLRLREAGRHEDWRNYCWLRATSQTEAAGLPVSSYQRAAAGDLHASALVRIPGLGGTHLAATFGTQGRFCTSADGSQLWTRVGQGRR